MKRLFVFSVFVFFLSGSLRAATDTTGQTRGFRTAGLNLHYGSIFAHSQDVENTRHSRPFGLDLVYSRLRNDSAVAALCGCQPHSGFILNYFNYDNRVLEQSFSALYFLEPNFRISNRLLWHIRGTVGVAYLTHPYHPQHNPGNMSYSLPFGAYLGVATGFNLKVSPQLMLAAGGNYLHISNGGIKDPNLGINWITGNLGLFYSVKGPYDFSKKKQAANAHYRKYRRLDLAGSYSSKIVYIGDKMRYPVFGLSALHAWQLSRLHTVTASAEWHIDYSLAEKQRRENAARDVHFWGAALGHEFLLGRFIFSQQLGCYLKYPAPYYDRIYHRWGLDFILRPNLHIGFNLKAHRHVAHFADIRLVYSLGRERKARGE